MTNRLILNNGTLAGFGNKNMKKDDIVNMLTENGVTHFDNDFKQKLLDGTIRAVTSNLVVTYLIGQAPITNIINATLVPKIGLRSFTNGKLDKDRPFLVQGIQLLAGQAPSHPSADKRLLLTPFETLEKSPVHLPLRSAMLSIQVNSKYELKDLATSVFETDHVHTDLKGFHKLLDSFLMLDQKPIVATLEMDPEIAADLVVDTAVKIIFHGITFIA